jgi:hypothetical protein
MSAIEGDADPSGSTMQVRSGSKFTVATAVSRLKIYRRKRTFWWSARHGQFVPQGGVGRCGHADHRLRQQAYLQIGKLYGLISCCCPSLLVNVKDAVVPLAPI